MAGLPICSCARSKTTGPAPFAWGHEFQVGPLSAWECDWTGVLRSLGVLRLRCGVCLFDTFSLCPTCEIPWMIVGRGLVL